MLSMFVSVGFRDFQCVCTLNLTSGATEGLEDMRHLVKCDCLRFQTPGCRAKAGWRGNRRNEMTSWYDSHVKDKTHSHNLSSFVLSTETHVHHHHHHTPIIIYLVFLLMYFCTCVPPVPGCPTSPYLTPHSPANLLCHKSIKNRLGFL